MSKPCEWCQKTSETIDSLEYQLEAANKLCLIYRMTAETNKASLELIEGKVDCTYELIFFSVSAFFMGIGATYLLSMSAS